MDRPSRWEAQADAVNLIFNAKTEANPESGVGLMSMGGKGPEVLVTLTTDFGKILEGMHRTKIRGSNHLVTGIQIAGVCVYTCLCSHASLTDAEISISSPSNTAKINHKGNASSCSLAHP